MRKILFVAEIGSLHKGDPGLAFEAIRQAKKAGATAIKFQLGHEKHGPDPQAARYAPMEWIPDLMAWGSYLGIGVFASIWSQEALQRAETAGMGMYKVGHQISENRAFIDVVVATGKPVFLASTPEKPVIRHEPNVHSIYVEPNYPTYHPQIPENFRGWYGYSSHAHGIGDALLAVARGAHYIEKHFCLDRELVTRDASFALLPDEFARMVEAGQEMARLL